MAAYYRRRNDVRARHTGIDDWPHRRWRRRSPRRDRSWIPAAAAAAAAAAALIIILFVVFVVRRSCR